jgi:hypothetical protein
MRVEICADGKKIATGQVGADGMISDVVPFEGRGIGYGRYVQIVATSGKHTGSSLTALVMGDTGTALTLKEPMPFK